MPFCAQSNQFAASSHSGSVTQTEVCACSILPIHAVICLGPGRWKTCGNGVVRRLASGLGRADCLRGVLGFKGEGSPRSVGFPSRCHQTTGRGGGIICNPSKSPRDKKLERTQRAPAVSEAADQSVAAAYDLIILYFNLLTVNIQNIAKKWPASNICK